jgi:hypothetical protein
MALSETKNIINKFSKRIFIIPTAGGSGTLPHETFFDHLIMDTDYKL